MMPNKKRSYNQQYYAENKGIISDRSKEYRVQNRDSIRDLNQRWYAENREAQKAYAKEYRAKNAEKLKAQRAAKYAAKREDILAYNREWRLANPDKLAASQERCREPYRGRAAQFAREWRKANPEQKRAYDVARKARKRGAEGRYGARDIRAIFNAQRGLCAYCKICLKEAYEVDHIIPLAKGGSNWPRNIQLTCGPCNRKKRDADPVDFARKLGLLI